MWEINDDLYLVECPLELAIGEGDLGQVSLENVVVQRRQTLKDATKLLEHAYDLVLLEAQLHCSNYHEEKNQFSKGVSYGYLSTYVRRDSGTNSMRFCKRVPLEKYVSRTNIKMTANGYSYSRLKRNAAHDEELSLAVRTEDEYEKLRSIGKKIKTAIRNIRAKPEEKTDEHP